MENAKMISSREAPMKQEDMFVRVNQTRSNMVNLILGVFKNQDVAISAKEAIEILEEAKSKITEIAYIYYKN